MHPPQGGDHVSQFVKLTPMSTHFFSYGLRRGYTQRDQYQPRQKAHQHIRTLGKLLNDDELYLQLEKAVTVLVGSLEEAREAAPISTFLNTVFLGF